jgi:hypothetical protein
MVGIKDRMGEIRAGATEVLRKAGRRTMGQHIFRCEVGNLLACKDLEQRQQVIGGNGFVQ